MASIRKREWTSRGQSRSAWLVDYFDQAGKRHVKTFATKKEAEAWRVTASHEVSQGTHTPTSTSATVTEATERWIANCEAEGLERSTIKQRRGHLVHHIAPFIGREKLSTLTAPRVYQFDTDLRTAGRSLAMRRKVLTNLKTMLSFAQTLFKSAFRGHGKSRALRVTEAFTANPIRSENATAAVFFRWTDEGYNVLLDEVDNLELMSDRNFRAALNSGYDRDGYFERHLPGSPRFKTFAAVALAGIGAVPLPLARRSIQIIMKYDPNADRTRQPNADRTRQLFDRRNSALENTLEAINVHLAAWASNAELLLRPRMPEQLTGGQCDVWRPLVSIADACGAELGECRCARSRSRCVAGSIRTPRS